MYLVMLFLSIVQMRIGLLSRVSAGGYMEKINTFLKSIYLGDRYCENVDIGENKIVIQINLISRIKKGCKEWNYYSDEDIEHGCLVFEDVVEYYLSSKLPFNDEIYRIQAIEKQDDIYSFIVYGCSVSDEALSTDIQLQIKAKRFYIYDPQNNRVIIN